MADASVQQQFRQRDVDYFRQEKARETAERDLVADHRQTLEQKLESERAEIQRLLTENRRIVAEIARAQFEAIQAIEERIREMALAEP
jgi:hypothetical protein